jgi:hypothetical protein
MNKIMILRSALELKFKRRGSIEWPRIKCLEQMIEGCRKDMEDRKDW